MEDKQHAFKWVVGLIPLLTSVLILILLFFIGIPAANKDIVLPLTGVFFGWGGAVVSYVFGAVSSSNMAKQTGKA